LGEGLQFANEVYAAGQPENPAIYSATAIPPLSLEASFFENWVPCPANETTPAFEPLVAIANEDRSLQLELEPDITTSLLAE